MCPGTNIVWGAVEGKPQGSWHTVTWEETSGGDISLGEVSFVPLKGMEPFHKAPRVVWAKNLSPFSEITWYVIVVLKICLWLLKILVFILVCLYRKVHSAKSHFSPLIIHDSQRIFWSFHQKVKCTIQCGSESERWQHSSSTWLYSVALCAAEIQL